MGGISGSRRGFEDFGRGGGGDGEGTNERIDKHAGMAVALSHARQTRVYERTTLLPPCPLQPCDHLWFFPRWTSPSVVGSTRGCWRARVRRTNLIFETPVTWQTRRCGRRLRKAENNTVEGVVSGGGWCRNFNWGGRGGGRDGMGWDGMQDAAKTAVLRQCWEERDFR